MKPPKTPISKLSIYMINIQTLVNDKAKTKQRHTNQIPRQQPFKEKLPPRVGLEPTTFSVLGRSSTT